VLKSNGVRKGISQVLQFLDRRCGRYEEPVAVAGCEMANDTRAANGSVRYGDYVISGSKAE
jgi:hypothetical protein